MMISLVWPMVKFQRGAVDVCEIKVAYDEVGKNHR